MVKVPRVLQIGPCARDRGVGPRANDEVAADRRRASVELPARGIAILNLHPGVIRSFEELIALGGVIHLHPKLRVPEEPTSNAGSWNQAWSSMPSKSSAPPNFPWPTRNCAPSGSTSSPVLLLPVLSAVVVPPLVAKLKWRIDCEPDAGRASGIKGDGHLVPLGAVDRAVDVWNDSRHGDGRPVRHSGTADLYVANRVGFVARRAGVVDRQAILVLAAAVDCQRKLDPVDGASDVRSAVVVERDIVVARAAQDRHRCREGRCRAGRA